MPYAQRYSTASIKTPYVLSHRMSRKERTYPVTCIASGYDSLSRVPVRLNLAQTSQRCILRKIWNSFQLIIQTNPLQTWSAHSCYYAVMDSNSWLKGVGFSCGREEDEAPLRGSLPSWQRLYLESSNKGRSVLHYEVRICHCGLKRACCSPIQGCGLLFAG
jgi:hypothetical protein